MLLQRCCFWPPQGEHPAQPSWASKEAAQHRILTWHPAAPLPEVFSLVSQLLGGEGDKSPLLLLLPTSAELPFPQPAATRRLQPNTSWGSSKASSRAGGSPRTAVRLQEEPPR